MLELCFLRKENDETCKYYILQKRITFILFFNQGYTKFHLSNVVTERNFLSSLHFITMASTPFQNFPNSSATHINLMWKIIIGSNESQ